MPCFGPKDLPHYTFPDFIPNSRKSVSSDPVSEGVYRTVDHLQGNFVRQTSTPELGILISLFCIVKPSIIKPDVAGVPVGQWMTFTLKPDLLKQIYCEAI